MTATAKNSRAQYFREYRRKKKLENATEKDLVNEVRKVGDTAAMIPGDVKGALHAIVEDAVEAAVAPLIQEIAQLRTVLDEKPDIQVIATEAEYPAPMPKYTRPAMPAIARSPDECP